MNILILEDNQEVAEVLERYILMEAKALGRHTKCYIANTIDQATTILMQKDRIDHLILDLKLEGEDNGITFAHSFREAHPDSKIHIFTGTKGDSLAQGFKYDSITNKGNHRPLLKELFGKTTTDTSKIKIIVDELSDKVEKSADLIRSHSKAISMHTSEIMCLNGDYKDLRERFDTMENAINTNHKENMAQHEEIKKRIPSFMQLAGLVIAALTVLITTNHYQDKQLEEKLILRIKVEKMQPASQISDSLRYALKMEMKEGD